MMLKEAIEKIVSLADPHIYAIGNETYTNDSMHRIVPHINRPEKMSFSSLDGVAKAIETEISKVTCPIFVHANKHNSMLVFTTYRSDNFERDLLYTAIPDLPEMPRDWMRYDDAMIALRSRYIQNEGTEYILNLLAHISNENSVQNKDNGLTQEVTVKQGISLAARAAVKPRVALKPFRTFLEIDQPESEFLLRLRSGNDEKGTDAMIGLFEADGGAWKLEAKHNIAAYFEYRLSDLIAAGKVIVAE